MAKERKLTKNEEERLALFNDLSSNLEKEGYHKVDLTASLIKGNTLGVLYGLLLCIPFLVLFIMIHGFNPFKTGENYTKNYLLFVFLMFVFIVVHELIHGITFSRFTKNGFKDISFGVIWKSLNPYCACKQALERNKYLTALLMPGFVLGVIPSIISLINGNAWWLFMGLLMISSAGGDILIGKMILEHENKKGSLYLDHPTDIGLVVFEK